MKEHIVHLLKYNQEADKQASGIFTGLSEPGWKQDRKSYYKSLEGLYGHIVGGALYFQKLLHATYPEFKGLDHKYLAFEINSEASYTLAEYQAALEVLDTAMITMVEALDDQDLNKKVVMSFPQAKLEYPLGVFLMMYITHGTHHRGQISQILDEMGIENNFGIVAPTYE